MLEAVFSVTPKCLKRNHILVLYFFCVNFLNAMKDVAVHTIYLQVFCWLFFSNLGSSVSVFSASDTVHSIVAAQHSHGSFHLICKSNRFLQPPHTLTIIFLKSEEEAAEVFRKIRDSCKAKHSLYSTHHDELSNHYMS